MKLGEPEILGCELKSCVWVMNEVGGMLKF